MIFVASGAHLQPLRVSMRPSTFAVGHAPLPPPPPDAAILGSAAAALAAVFYFLAYQLGRHGDVLVKMLGQQREILVLQREGAKQQRDDAQLFREDNRKLTALIQQVVDRLSPPRARSVPSGGLTPRSVTASASAAASVAGAAAAVAPPPPDATAVGDPSGASSQPSSIFAASVESAQ